MRLSILICSITERNAKLRKLLSLLEKQKNEEVEVLVETDNREMTTGKKRNILLQRAKGDYVAFIDDDDMVVGDYVSKILRAIETNPDCCGIEGIITERRKKSKFIHSIKYDHWYTSGGIYYRMPNHLSPVKRVLALKAMFPEIDRSEDHAYSLRLFSLLKTEVYIKNPIYFYYAG